MNALRLARNLRLAGYHKVHLRLHHYIHTHGLPCDRKVRGGEHVRILSSREGYEGMVAIDLVHGHVICDELHVLARRKPAHSGGAKRTVGVRLQPATIEAIEARFPNLKTSQACRRIIEAYIRGGTP